jgi:hypothetical protein
MTTIIDPKVIEGIRQRFALEGVMKKMDPKFKKWFQYTLFTVTRTARSAIIQAELEKLQRVVVLGDEKTLARISRINLKTKNQRLALFMSYERANEGFPGVAFEGSVRIDGKHILVANNPETSMEHFLASDDTPKRHRGPIKRKSKKQRTK